MNARFVVRQLGLLMLVLSLSILVTAAWSLFDVLRGDALEAPSMRALLITFGVGLVLGGTMWWGGRGHDEFLGRREALLLVAVSWLFGAALSALPYWLWALQATDADSAHPYRGYFACYFEAMSGLTTTGATVLNGNVLPDGSPHPSSIEALPKGLLLWRSLTHWLGGLGIVMLFVAVLPTLGVGGKKLFQAEATGPQKTGVRPRIRETARVLWLIYLGLTIVLAALLMLCGLNFFDAINHTFATLATGGFSTKNASIAAFDSLTVEIVIIVFMVLAGVNFGLYYQIIRGRWRTVWTDPELRLYLLIIFGMSVFVTGCLVEQRIVSAAGVDGEPSIAAAVRHGIFQVVSIQTTTGFVTADFDLWGFFPKSALLALMFVGASAGSTGGGIKVIRFLIAFKIMLAEVERIFHPNVVRPVKIGRAHIDPELRQATLVYVMGIFVLFIVGAMLIMLFESHNPQLIAAGNPIDFTTAASASAATLNNIGPGLELVGAAQNYGWFTAPSMLVMSLLMALGRLEVYAIFVLFLPRFWRGD